MATWQEWHERENYLGPDEWEAMQDYLRNDHKNPETEQYDWAWVEAFHDCYQGYWPTFADFVETQVRDLCDIPDYLDHHIDWDSMARDWQHDYWYSDNGHVFRND